MAGSGLVPTLTVLLQVEDLFFHMGPTCNSAHVVLLFGRNVGGVQKLSADRDLHPWILAHSGSTRVPWCWRGRTTSAIDASTVKFIPGCALRH